MTANINNPEPTLRDLADKIDQLTAGFEQRFNEVDERFNEVDERFNEVDKRFNEVDERFAILSQALERSNDKFDTYQKATQWVVQLAFTLIASATITIILSTVFK
jgi:septation ring formation regulator EzrA